MDLKDTMKKIEALCDDYMEIIQPETEAYQLGNGNMPKILDDWWFSLVFFFDRVFYQGRRDELSTRYKLATINSLNSLLGKDNKQKLTNLLDLNSKKMLNYKEKNNPIKKALEVNSAGKTRDQEMTIDILHFIVNNLQSNDYNILKYAIEKIRKNKIKELFKELDAIRQIGPKTGRFFIRDTVIIYGLTNQLKKTDYLFLQPIDTWVRQIAKKLKISPEESTDYQLTEKIIDTCLANDISPIKFNIGLWVLGSRSLDVIFKWCFNS